MSALSIEEQKFISETLIPKKDIDSFIKIMDKKNVNSIINYDDSLWSVFFLVTYFDFKDGIKYLLDRKVDINYVAPDSTQVMLIATQKENVSLLKRLIALGCSVEVKDDNGLTPLMMACEQNKPELVKLFLDNKANVFAKDNNGKNCLDYAYKKNNYEIITFLEQSIYSKKFKEGKQKSIVI